MKKSKIFILLIFSSIIFGQGPSVADRYGDRIELLGIPFKDPCSLPNFNSYFYFNRIYSIWY